MPYLFRAHKGFSSNFSVITNIVLKTWEMGFGSYLTTLSSLRAFIVAMETLFRNSSDFRVFHSSLGLPVFFVSFVSKYNLFFQQLLSCRSPDF